MRKVYLSLRVEVAIEISQTFQFIFIGANFSIHWAYIWKTVRPQQNLNSDRHHWMQVRWPQDPITKTQMLCKQYKELFEKLVTLLTLVKYQ